MSVLIAETFLFLLVAPEIARFICPPPLKLAPNAATLPELGVEGREPSGVPGPPAALLVCCCAPLPLPLARLLLLMLLVEGEKEDDACRLLEEEGGPPRLRFRKKEEMPVLTTFGCCPSLAVVGLPIPTPEELEYPLSRYAGMAPGSGMTGEAMDRLGDAGDAMAAMLIPARAIASSKACSRWLVCPDGAVAECLAVSCAGARWSGGSWTRWLLGVFNPASSSSSVAFDMMSIS